MWMRQSTLRRMLFTVRLMQTNKMLLLINQNLLRIKSSKSLLMQKVRPSLRINSKSISLTLRNKVRIWKKCLQEKVIQIKKWGLRKMFNHSLKMKSTPEGFNKPLATFNKIRLSLKRTY